MNIVKIVKIVKKLPKKLYKILKHAFSRIFGRKQYVNRNVRHRDNYSSKPTFFCLGDLKLFKVKKVLSKLIDIFRFCRERPFICVSVLALIVILIFIAYNQYIFLPKPELQFSASIEDDSGIATDTSFILKSKKEIDQDSINNYLKFQPQINYKIEKVSNNNRKYKIIPEEHLLEDTVYSVHFSQCLAVTRNYNWAFQVKDPMQIKSTLPRHQAVEVPLNSSVEVVFSHENIINFDNHFEITPDIRGRFEHNYNIVTFIPEQNFVPETIYTIKIKSGVGSTGSSDILNKDYEFNFETKHEQNETPKQNFNFIDTFYEFSPNVIPYFDVYAKDIPENQVPLTVYRFSEEREFVDSYMSIVDAPNIWSRYNSQNFFIPDIEKKIIESNITIENILNNNVINLPQKLSIGWYLIDVVINEKHQQAWVQICDLVSFMSISETKTIIWFKNVNLGTNTENVEVLYEDEVVASSNKDGVALFETPKELVNKKKDYTYWNNVATSFFEARKNDQKIAIPIESNYGGIGYGIEPADLWWDYFSVDKGIYQPSDTINFWGVVKNRNGIAINGLEATIQLVLDDRNYSKDQSHTVFAETKSIVSDFNTITGSIKYSNIKSGYYKLSLKIGEEEVASEYINIKSYLKPSYKLIMNADKNAIFAGETINYTIRAEFFDSTPVSNLKVKYYGNFGKQSFKGELQLDEKGEASFSITPEYDDSRYWPAYLETVVRPLVAEEGEITSRLSTIIFGPNITMKSDHVISDDGISYDLKINKIIPQNINQHGFNQNSYLGEVVRGKNVKVEVKQVNYIKTQTGNNYDYINKTTNPIYRYEESLNTVYQTTVSTDSNGIARFFWHAEKDKNYKLYFSAKDSNQKTVIIEKFIYGYGLQQHLDKYNTNDIQLKSVDSQENYKIGEKVHLQMINNNTELLPPDAGNYLYININQGITAFTSSDSPEYSKIFSDSDVPNTEVMGVWFNGRYFQHAKDCQIFESNDRKLNIEIKQDKEKYRPGEIANLDINVRDKDGKPKEAEINLAVIDEAVFNIQPQDNDIIDGLYQINYASLISRSSHYVESSGRGGCLIAGTKIWTVEGQRSIEELKIGDEVYTLENNKSQTIVKTKVQKLTSHVSTEQILINGQLQLTPDHPLLVNGIWALATEVKSGDKLLSSDGGEIKVVSVDRVRQGRLVYNLSLDSPHTFFANGIYTHNKNSGVRGDFVDIALYKNIVSDANGSAKISFNLPDNLTSWRITAQAVDKDLFAGDEISFIKVGLPFFVNVSLNNTYLTGDRVVMKLKVFGLEANSDNIHYSVECDTLPFKKIEKTDGKTTEIDIGDLSQGEHQIKIVSDDGQHSDSIIRKIRVSDSNYIHNIANEYELQNGPITFQGAESGYTLLDISSGERSKYLPHLDKIAKNEGSRIDQKFASWLAYSYENRYFDQENELKNFELWDYQLISGGISLLPYDSENLQLSAYTANLITGESVSLDKNLLKQYFYSKAIDTNISNRIISLYGLSAFGEPVLVSLQNCMKLSGLKLSDKIYIILALDNLGATEIAREYYLTQIKPKLINNRPNNYVKISNNRDDSILFTALLNSFATKISDSKSKGMTNYILNNFTKFTSNNFQMLLFLKNVLPQLGNNAVSFSYFLSGEKKSIELHGNQLFTLALNNDDIKKIKFSDVKGKVGIVARFQKKIQSNEIKNNNKISILRSYSVNGITSDEIKEGDLVLVHLKPFFSSDALDGNYEIIDYLPSGLRAVTDYHLGSIEERSSDYHLSRYVPNQIDDQKVTFYINKNYPNYLCYYARVVSKGTYQAEPTLIQSIQSPIISSISIGKTFKIN